MEEPEQPHRLSQRQPARRGRPGLPTLQKALRAAAKCLQIERSLRHRIETREQQLRLLRRHDPGGVREQIDTECEELRRLLLQNGRVLATALETAQAINETLPEPIDVDARLMTELSALERQVLTA
jgi:hypothetical protein